MRVNSYDHLHICLLWPQFLVLKLTVPVYHNSRLYVLSDGITPVDSLIMCKSYNLVLKWVYLYHFIPNSVNSGDRFQTELGINPLGLSALWADTLYIISLWPVKKLTCTNPMSLSTPWSNSCDIIALNPVKTILGINQMGLGAPWAYSLYIISFQPVKTFLGIKPM